MTEPVVPPKLPAQSLLPRVLRDFMQVESSSGVVMVVVAAVAMLLANTVCAEWYATFVETPLAITVGGFQAAGSLSLVVRDVLMVLFFLVVGMELKREMREGFLAQRDQILLPLVAALGGIAVPALIYILLNAGQPDRLAGWAIPSATDIAFALCVLSLVGKGIPPSIKIFLLAIAIFDDLCAILIIALFYSHGLQVEPLLWAAVGVAGLVLLNWRNITLITPYILIGIFLWFCLHDGGIHTTIAGVIVGLAIPMRDRDHHNHSPLNHAVHNLHPWVSFLVLPLFAFVSAGIPLGGITWADTTDPVPLGIALGLVLGKQVGIFGVTGLLVATGLVKKPAGASWLHIYGVSVVAGIGFTMSLFIGLLAFSNSHVQELAKVGVIGGSLLAALWGYAVLRWSVRRKA